jgi:hypothetical protein
MKNKLFSVASLLVLGCTHPASAQTSPPVGLRERQPAGGACELHVWPTENYLGVSTGLLSGFGAVGALADMAATKGKVQSVKDFMREYPGPDAQVAELERLAFVDRLKLGGYRVMIEEPTPFSEDLKTDPGLKARAKLMNARLKSGERLSDSQNPCYAELVTTHIFYHKAMMYGSNLFTGWVFREFGGKPKATFVASGQVKNPLEVFPPKDVTQVDAAKTELRDAFAKDFSEYVQKKVRR